MFSRIIENLRDVRAERAWRSWFVDIKLQMDVAEGSVREFRNQSLIVVIGNICDPPYFPAKNPKRRAANPSNPWIMKVLGSGIGNSVTIKALNK